MTFEASIILVAAIVSVCIIVAKAILQPLRVAKVIWIGNQDATLSQSLTIRFPCNVMLGETLSLL